MSESCLRKLNREREYDLNKKLNLAYKNLLKNGITLSARNNMASLMFCAEK